MTLPGESDSIERTFRWLCKRQTADDLAELMGVHREEIFLWHRDGMPGELPPQAVVAMERRAQELNGPGEE